MSAKVLTAGTGTAFKVQAGSTVAVVNTHGQQVVDTWAISASGAVMSMSHTRGILGKLSPALGDDLFSDRRRAMMRITVDTSPGGHDTLIAACDAERYRQLGSSGAHPNCADNFVRAAEPAGITLPVPDPLNLFMNIPVGHTGELEFAPSRCAPGDLIELLALVDLTVVFSACPQDLVPINGERGTPADVELIVSAPS